MNSAVYFLIPFNQREENMNWTIDYKHFWEELVWIYVHCGLWLGLRARVISSVSEQTGGQVDRWTEKTADIRSHFTSDHSQFYFRNSFLCSVQHFTENTFTPVILKQKADRGCENSFSAVRVCGDFLARMVCWAVNKKLRVHLIEPLPT